MIIEQPNIELSENVRKLEDLWLSDKKPWEYLLYWIWKDIFEKIRDRLSTSEWFMYDNKKFADICFSYYLDNSYLIWFLRPDNINEETALSTLLEICKTEDEFSHEVWKPDFMWRRKRETKWYLINIWRSIKILENWTIEGDFHKTLSDQIKSKTSKEIQENLDRFTEKTGLFLLVINLFERKLSNKFHTNAYYYKWQIFSIKKVLLNIWEYIHTLFDKESIYKYGERYLERALTEYFFYAREIFDSEEIVWWTKNISSSELKEAFTQAYKEIVEKFFKLW